MDQFNFTFVVRAGYLSVGNDYFDDYFRFLILKFMFPSFLLAISVVKCYFQSSSGITVIIVNIFNYLLLL